MDGRTNHGTYESKESPQWLVTWTWKGGVVGGSWMEPECSGVWREPATAPRALAEGPRCQTKLGAPQTPTPPLSQRGPTAKTGAPKGKAPCRDPLHTPSF